MSAVRSALSCEQEKQLGSLLGHARLSLLYKGRIHGYTAADFHTRCDRQGPTVVVAYNKAGFIFGAFTSKDYTQCGKVIADDKAFLFSFREGDGGKSPLRIAPKSKPWAFLDSQWGPDFKGLDFLYANKAAVQSNPGRFYDFQEEEMHGGDLVLTDFEAYRVEDLGGFLEKPWRNVLWSSNLRPTMSAVTSALSCEQEKQLGSLLGHVRLSLLYKGSVHGYTAVAFHARCDRQGPTVVVAYNKAGFIFGAFTSKDYTQCGKVIADDKAFLFSFQEGDSRKSPLRITPKSKARAFLDSQWGPNFNSLDFLFHSKAAVHSNPGSFYNFEAKEMHGGDLVLTEFEVYRVEDFGGLLEKPWKNVLWSSDLLPTMSAVRSALSREQEKQLVSLLGHVRLSLLYKASVHGYTAAAFHARCDRQGPTVVVAYNKAGFIFGGFTSKNYTQHGQVIADDKAFLFSFREGDGRKSPLHIMPKSKAQAFTDGNTGPNFGSLVFLNGNKAAVASNPGSFYNFEAAEMHGGDLVLTECEVYRVEDLGSLLEKPWRNVLWGSDLRPTMSAVRSALSREQEKQLGSLLGHVRLSLLYKGSVHGYTAVAFHARCDRQGPTVVVAYNKAGFIFGAFTSKEFTQCREVIADDKAFLFSFREGEGGKSPLRITPKSKNKAFFDTKWGPNFDSLDFLYKSKAAVHSNPGSFYNFKAKEMHGGDLVLTEFEVYRVEELQTTFLQSFPRRPPRSDLLPTMSAVRSTLSREQEKQLGSLLGHARLSLLYKGSVHGYTTSAFHARCDWQGPTVVVAYNKAGFIFGAFTSKDYTQHGQVIADDKAFLFSFREGDGGKSPLRIMPKSEAQAFTDGNTGPNFGSLVFLNENQAAVASNPGSLYNFEAAEMHGGDLVLTECEVYRVEDLGGLLEKPWRNILWSSEKKKELMEFVRNYKPILNAVRQARILLIGPVGVGKSSFFNSINSIFQGYVTSQAIAGSTAKSLTTQFRSYQVKAGGESKPLPFVMCDTMGLEEATGEGLQLDDITSVLKGHVMDRYQFNPSVPVQPDSPKYRKSPALGDMVHCVVYVLDGSKVKQMKPKLLDKLHDIRRRVNLMGIPQLVLMTKVDEACQHMGTDVKQVYHSHYIQRKVEELGLLLGIPMSCIIPVKNYSQELDLDLNSDILLLTAVQQMLRLAKSYFDDITLGEDEESRG